MVQDGRLLEAEELMDKIEELKDQEYNEARSTLLTQNDVEMNELLNDRTQQIKVFNDSWNAHEAQLVESGMQDLNSLEEA